MANIDLAAAEGQPQELQSQVQTQIQPQSQEQQVSQNGLVLTPMVRQMVIPGLAQHMPFATAPIPFGFMVPPNAAIVSPFHLHHPLPANFQPGVLPAPPHPPGFPVGSSHGSMFLDSPSELDLHRTRALEKFIEDAGLVLNQEEQSKRRKVLEKLEKIVKKWLECVALEKANFENIKGNCNAKILTFGSYRLGVHGPEADIDALCVGPNYATLEDDFFTVLFNMLKDTPDVSEVQCVKGANVPLMRFKFNGISIDLLYAKLSFQTIPENMDILDEKLLANLDDSTTKSLNGCRVAELILRLVPNVENFRKTLRCIKFWARRRGIYSHIFGFLGGIHWAVLVARICQLFPNASVSMLVSRFFWVYAQWRWSIPVTLIDRQPEPTEGSDRHHSMQIVLPVPPYTSCSYNVTHGTFKKLTTEFSRGLKTIMEMESNWGSLPSSADWNNLFEPYPFFSTYEYYIQIFLTTPEKDDIHSWRGWVESRFRHLLLRLEKLQTQCDPNPSPYFDKNKRIPHCYFFWGMALRRNIRVDVLALEKEFRTYLGNGYEGPSGCNIGLTLLNRYQLPVYVHSKSAELRQHSEPYWITENDNFYRRTLRYPQFCPAYFVGYAAFPNETTDNSGY